MFSRWSRAVKQIYGAGSRARIIGFNNSPPPPLVVVASLNYAKVAAPSPNPSVGEFDKAASNNTVVSLDKLFWSKPCSLALAKDSPLRVEEPNYVGIRWFILRLLLFYTHQSKSIRSANVIYKRIVSQVDKPAIYTVFSLEKTFKTTFSLLVLHMWLCLRRLKEEGREGVELGQYVYEIYNHDLELRVSKAGVNLLLIRWMKDLEKIFYGNIVAYDTAMLPEAKKDELPIVIYRNIFSEDGSSSVDDTAKVAVQAMSRYVQRETSCLSLTDKESMFSGNFTFTSLETPAFSARSNSQSPGKKEQI